MNPCRVTIVLFAGALATGSTHARADHRSDGSSADQTHLERSSSDARRDDDAPVKRDDDAPVERDDAAKSAAPRGGDGARSMTANNSSAAPPGREKSGVSSQAISVPKGAGKIDGMGESFSMELSTGIGTFTVPIAAPPARGAAEPSLQLAYSTSRGPGVAGVGWNLPVPYIARESDRGLPRYGDPLPGGPWHEGQDRFVFGAGQELVPICLVGGALECAGKLDAEVMPSWAAGWQYFRSRVEGAFLRFFWSPDHDTWVVQAKSGVVLELGKPLDGSGYAGALESDPGDAARVFRWNIVRQYDAQRELAPPQGQAPRPVNVIAYRYLASAGLAYLSDVYHTPPAVGAADADVSAYAHHLRLEYEERPDVGRSYRRGWLTQSLLRLARVDVTSRPFSGGVAVPRELVRRMHLGYEPGSHVSLLSQVTVEGRCALPVAESATGGLPPTSCEALPALDLGYAHVEPFDGKGAATTPDLPGYEGFDDRVVSIANSPKYSLDGSTTDLFDINGDALPDVLVTLPGLFQGKHGVFLLGKVANQFAGKSTMAVQGVLGADAGVIALSNPNVAPLDADGDGIVDLLHMPKVKKYAVYAASAAGWVGREVTTASAQSPKIDFQQDADRTRVMDVDGDGLVDVVFTGGTEVQTFFNLGYRPQGDGQFGHIDWDAPLGPALSNDPATACRPWSSTPVGFDDPDVVIADMNGDGLPDIVRVRKGDIRYWPGRGNGFWGTGALDDCAAGSFAVDRHVEMSDGPTFSQTDAPPRLDDINGDGLDDLIQVRFNAVDIWLNVDGAGWTLDRHIIQGTPPVSPIENRVRLVDANGSGSRDILWGDGFSYRYVDPLGAARPWVLTKIENGLGKSTTIEYETSTEQMLAAAPAWTSVMPTVAHVVARVTERDHLDAPSVGLAAGEYVTEYQYRDPFYEGRQREFRGFRVVRARSVGDGDSPTTLTETTFLLGECRDETIANGVDECAAKERWRDNPREALKGTAVIVETSGETAPFVAGVYASTLHATVRLRQLYQGLDGRVVREAFPNATDAYLYDAASFDGMTSVVGQVAEVELQLDPQSLPESVAVDTTRSLSLRSTGGRARTRAGVTLDVFGNQTVALAQGCVEGCVPADESIASVASFDRPANDTTGWLWRNTESYVAPHPTPPGAERDRMSTSYDHAGNPVTITAELTGTLPLDRFHELPGAAVAPVPSTASTDGTLLVAQNVYDELGNLVLASGAEGRCRAVEPDATYGELPATETVFTGGCGLGPLTTSSTYDRGLGVPLQVTDVRGEATSMVYDGFGRLVQLFRPHPTLAGLTSPVASLEVEYHLTEDAVAEPFSRIRIRTQDGASASDPAYHDAWAFVDGLGRTIMALDEADPTAGDGGGWIVSGRVERTKKGVAFKTFLPCFADGDPDAFDLGAPCASAHVREKFDAFGRVLVRFALDSTVALYVEHHALSEDAWDGEDFVQGLHFGTYASTRRDGHGRVVATTERVKEAAQIELREVRTAYLPTGEPFLVQRVRVGGNEPPVARWFRYDSLGRRVLNVEPSTSVDFTPVPTADPSSFKAVRYAYDDAGEVVGTSDARGCGNNFHYDGAGRLLAEDHSPCQSHHAEYSAPDLVSGEGTEAFNRYDAADPETASASQCPIEPGLLLGRLVSVSDRASKTLTGYDGRGRVTCVAKRIARPGEPATDLSERYAPTWYEAAATFDAADRQVTVTTGAAVSELMGLGAQSLVATTYSARGTVASVGGSYGTLVESLQKAADGLTTEIVYGDVAPNGTPQGESIGTTTTKTYDTRRRLVAVQTSRAAPGGWSLPPPGYVPAPSDASGTLQTLLEKTAIVYDLADNPVSIQDLRDAAEWPAGAMPASRTMVYDDLYRLVGIDHQHSGGPDSWTSPFAAEDAGETDPRRAAPAPRVSYEGRVQTQTWGYDWLGNTTASDDDSGGFYDRSLGTISRSTYQLTAATNQTVSPPSPNRQGSLTAAYDASGNLASLAVQRDGPCLPLGALCDQRFVYEWDEVGRLARARRWDLPDAGLASDPVPSEVPAAELRHAYDADDGRVIKTAVSPDGDLHTLYVFGSLELRRATWLDDASEPEAWDYERTALTEVPYLAADGMTLARVHYQPADETPTVGGATTHVLLELEDQLGSTSIVIDRSTGELVEHATYLAYGEADSSYRPERWGHFREDDRFTGKEEDVEVGLVYFGFRYYAPALGCWVSPDPLAVESLEADLNVYAYVQGRVLASTDPVGLDPAQVNVDFGAGSENLVSVVPGLPGEKDLLTRNVAEYEAYRTSAPVEFVNSRGGIPLQYLGPMNEMARPSAGPSFAETVAQRMGETGSGPNPFSVEGGDAAVTARGATVAGHAGGDGKLSPGHRGGATKLDQAMALTGIWGFSADLEPEKGKSGGLVGGLCPSCDGSAGGQALYTAASLVPIGKAGELLTKLTKKHYRLLARNPALVAEYLTKKEMLAGARMYAANFGKALERAVGRDVKNNYRHLLEYLSGPGKAGPDFRGVGRYARQIFDITTFKGQASHYAREYGKRLRLILYRGKPKKWP